MVRYVNGDILSNLDNSQYIFICQQVNCQGVMGAGLAKQIRMKWPIVFTQYKQLCDRCAPVALFSNYQVVNVSEKIYVINIFGQLNYGTDKQHTSYSAISSAFQDLFTDCLDIEKCKVTFRIPYGFGCGLGGGNWNVVSSIIENIANQLDVNVEIWKLP